MSERYLQTTGYIAATSHCSCVAGIRPAIGANGRRLRVAANGHVLDIFLYLLWIILFVIGVVLAGGKFFSVVAGRERLSTVATVQSIL